MAPTRAFKRLGGSLPPTGTEPSNPLDEFPREVPDQASGRVPFQRAPVDPDEFPREVASQNDPRESFRSFLTEHRARSRAAQVGTPPGRRRSYAALAVGIGLFNAVVVLAVLYRDAGITRAQVTTPVLITESTVTLTSAPSGAGVYIDGVRAGETPISLSLPIGVHTAELRSGTSSRRASLSVEAGKIVTQHVDFGSSPVTGGLQITSEPAGARVSVDGTRRGLTPLTIPEVAPGQHRVTILSGQTSVNRTVEVTAGATATVVVSVPKAPSNGWVDIQAPVDVEVYEGGRLLGSGRVSRVSLPAGKHTIELVSRAPAFRTESIVDVASGRSVALSVPLPNGRLSISALPWADVSVDGRALGQTPIGNLSLPFGTHEVVWRHPDHGERRQLVLVGAEHVRVGFDWTR